MRRLHYTVENLPFGKFFIQFYGVRLSAVEVWLKLRAAAALTPFFSVKRCEPFLLKKEETKWYNVEPVLWKIDRENNQLISKHSIINGLFEYNSYLYWGSHVRFSDKKTTKYLENTFLKELLQSVKLKKVIVYEDFNDLESIIKENNNFKNFEDLVEIEFNGPALNSKELNYVRGALGKNIKMNFITIEKEEGKKFDKYKVIKAKEEAENKEKLNQDYQSILKNIKELRLLIESFAQNKMVSNDMLRNLYSSIRVPDDMLIVKVKDHFEFNPDLLDVLDCIDLSRVDAHNLKLSNLDLRNKNITFDPQVIYRKDLSNSKLADHNVIWSSFKGVNLSGADIGDEKESYDIDQAKIDENTILPEKKSKSHAQDYSLK